MGRRKGLVGMLEAFVSDDTLEDFIINFGDTLQAKMKRLQLLRTAIEEGQLSSSQYNFITSANLAGGEHTAGQIVDYERNAIPGNSLVVLSGSVYVSFNGSDKIIDMTGDLRGITDFPFYGFRLHNPTPLPISYQLLVAILEG